VRIAIVSPFLDKRHGTERCVCEQIEHLVAEYNYEIHIYSPRVEDIADVQVYTPATYAPDKPGIWWHHIPEIALPLPYIIQYSWWFLANHLWRWADAFRYRLHFDLVFTPGINCLDADVIAIHIVFAEFYERVRANLNPFRNTLRFLPWLLHRRLYYSLIVALESIIYPHKARLLTAISHKTASDTRRFYAPDAYIPVIYYGLDPQQFDVDVRARLRPEARQELGLHDTTFALLLVGNDWKKKGLETLLAAVGQLGLDHVQVLVVGRDVPDPYYHLIAHYGLQQRVRFLPLRPDVEWYYAAADAYIGPSLEDAFALPPAEAMRCGVATVVSSQAGVSELVRDGIDAFVLRDPTSSAELVPLLRALVTDDALRQQLETNGRAAVQSLTWERNAAKLDMLLQLAALRRSARKNNIYGNA
jgi:UDP-glucose:(heptosyl)LPS alpha-1,3-glucosyltransferase